MSIKNKYDPNFKWLLPNVSYNISMKTFFFLFLFIFSSQLQAQSIALFDIDSTYFPVIKGKFYVNPQANYAIDDFRIVENGIQRKILKIDCPTPKKAKPPLLLLVVMCQLRFIG